MELFFSDSRKGFGLLIGLGAALQPCEVNNTFFASGKAKNGVFSLRIADIAPFYTINFFF